MKLRSFWLLAIVFCSLQIHAQQKLTIEEAVMGQFRQFAPESLDQLGWMKGSDTYYYVKNNAVWTGTVKSKSQDTEFFTLDNLNTWKSGTTLTSIPRIQWIDSGRFYFVHERKCYEINVKKKTSQVVCEYPSGIANSDYHVKTRQLAYTVDNNLYAVVNSQPVQITKNTEGIVSGQSISRNEYGISKGTFWNVDGSRLAFYQKDETAVSNYPLTSYKEVPAKVKEIKYPFSGMPSEKVSVGVYDVASGKTVFLDVKDGTGTDQYYLTNLGWSSDNKTIYVAWLNRATTDMRLTAFDAQTGKEVKTLFTEHDDKWLEPDHPVIFVPNKSDKFLWFSRRDGFNNLYLYDTNGALLNQTKAKFDITSFIGFDTKGEYAFVMGTGDVPTNSLCYRIHLKDMSMTVVSQTAGVHSAKISDSGNYIIDEYSNLSTPNKIDLLDAKGALIKNLLTSKNPYDGYSIGKTELFSIKAKNGNDLWCRLIKPTDFDSQKKYPVVVYVYNGPHVQLVTNNFLGGASLWMNQLAEDGFLVFTLDGHGSAHRGKDFEQIIHRQLGTQETEDQLLGVEWLKNQPFVDAERMAVHGWSYGGFMTGSLMLRTPGTFKAGIAGGPVIDWALYEVMYCERYMDTPQENPEGYKTSDLTQHVKNLQGDLLMIHGTDDDVVVMQHNMKFLQTCVENGVQVDFFAYPGHAHNVRGKDRVHLITKVVEYIKEKL